MIFLPEQISKLNELETLVFDFIIKSPEEVQQMTIRDLASQVHVSTSTIVRLCTKLGFEGWADLKFYLKNQLKEKTPEEQHYDNMAQAGGEDAAEHDLVHVFGLHAGPVQGLFDDGGAQLGGGGVLQGPAEGTDGSAAAVDDINFSHDVYYLLNFYRALRGVPGITALALHYTEDPGKMQ